MTKKEENLIKRMKEDELKKKFFELKEKIRVLRFKAEGSKSKNIKEPLILRRQVARVLTEMNKRKV